MGLRPPTSEEFEGFSFSMMLIGLGLLVYTAIAHVVWLTPLGRYFFTE